MICLAPSVNLNFDQSGNVTACCYNRSFVLGTYPKESIEEIWRGEKAEELRRFLGAGDLSHGCDLCQEQLALKNYMGMRARHFDEFASGSKTEDFHWPKIMEFEISNACNLECIMCTGHFSSLIRKNREKLPPLKNPYDSKFVDQLKPFLPHLRWAKFLGGEPFLNPMYFQIWKELARLNPQVQISITTNGTVLNSKVEQVLETMKPDLVISIDSLEPENYTRIRKNADYDQMRSNLEWFLAYGERHQRMINIAVCPMVNNWMDIPQVVNFCGLVSAQVAFNMVIWPNELSLKFAPKSERQKALTFLINTPVLQSAPAGATVRTSRVIGHNLQCYRDLINQLEGWNS